VIDSSQKGLGKVDPQEEHRYVATPRVGERNKTDTEFEMTTF